jgi:hypothetical protein
MCRPDQSLPSVSIRYKTLRTGAHVAASFGGFAGYLHLSPLLSYVFCHDFPYGSSAKPLKLFKPSRLSFLDDPTSGSPHVVTTEQEEFVGTMAAVLPPKESTTEFAREAVSLFDVA